jgi:hypothetical protein
VVAQEPHAARDCGVVGHDRAALAVRAEVLAGVEAEAAGARERPDAATLVECAVRLRRVLDDDEIVALGYFVHGVHVRRLAVEVDGDDGARALGHGALQLCGVEVVGDGVAVHEDGRGPYGRDGLGRGEEGVGRDDDLVAGADAARQQREVERRRAVRDADALARADVVRELALERLDLAPEHEGRRVEHALDGRVNLGLERAVLRL